MGLSHGHVGPNILAKIQIYILTKAELLFTLCSEIPCISNRKYTLIKSTFNLIFNLLIFLYLGNKTASIRLIFITSFALIVHCTFLTLCLIFFRCFNASLFITKLVCTPFFKYKRCQHQIF